MTPIEIAELAHEANRVYCKMHGDETQQAWADAPQWQKDSALDGVLFNLNNPDAPASASHERWLKKKLEDGWDYGNVKDPVNRLHPCIRPFDQLPAMQQAKDHLFSAIVKSLASFVPTQAPAKNSNPDVKVGGATEPVPS